jgi:hypothetical protein
MKIIIKISSIIIIFFCFNCSKKIDNTDIFIPEINVNCRRSQCIKNQWYDVKYSKKYYIIVINDDAELKSKPKNSSLVLRKINRFSRVTAIYIKPDYELINNKNHQWIFVRDCYSDNIYGWILDSNLGFKNDFKLYTNSNFKSIDFFDGDVNYKINIFNDGTFKGEWINQYPAAKKKNGETTGYIYKFMDNLEIIKAENNEPPLFINLKDEYVKVEML